MNNNLKELFNSILSTNKRISIKLLGDSITHGMGGTGYRQNGQPIADDFRRNPDGYCWANLFKKYMEENFNCSVTNNGCTGTEIDFIIDKFELLVDDNDDLVICTIGTNNRDQEFKEGTKRTKQEHMNITYGKILKMYEKFVQKNMPVIFMANIPATEENERDGEDYWRLISMKDICNLYIKASEECGFPLINMYQMFSEYCDKNGIILDDILPGGLHPNDEGYDIMFKLIKDALLDD